MKRLITMMLLIALCLSAFSGCDQLPEQLKFLFPEEEDTQETLENDSSASDLPLLLQKETLSFDNVQRLSGVITEKTFANTFVLQVVSWEWDEYVYVITEDVNDWCVGDAVAVYFFSVDRPKDAADRDRIYASRIEALTEPEAPMSFSKYFDEINMVPGLSQSKFRDQVEAYRYNGTALSKFLSGWHYDGASGGGWSASTVSFSFLNDYTKTEDLEYANYQNSIYTKVPLEGLMMPYRVSFDDTLEDVLEKIGVDVDVQTGFVSDEGNVGVMTLYSDKRESLKLTNGDLLPNVSVKEEFTYQLTYTECYEVSLTDGRTDSVTREIVFSFAGESDTLHSLKIRVNECYPLQKTEL